MSQCVAITKKGDRCRNKALTGFDKCHIHAKNKPKVSDLKPKSLCDAKLCDVNKICNPVTGRCVSLTGNIGKKLIQGRVYDEVKPEPQVKSNKILNPYLKNQVDPHGKDNCGPDRLTLDRIPKTNNNRAILSRYCDVLPLNDVKYIVGPYKYTEFNYKNYKIGLFGEKHIIRDFPKSSKDDTLTFSAFLTSLVTQTKRQYDLFVELSYRNRGVKPTDVATDNCFMLNILEYDFKDCLQVEKGACPYKNLRVHYADRRFLYPEQKNNLAYELYSFIGNSQNPPIHLLNKFLKTAKEKYDEYTKFILEGVLHDKKSKIAKQLQYNELSKEITDFIQKDIQARKNTFMIDLKLNSKTVNKDFTKEAVTDYDLKVIRGFVYDFMYIFTPIMDTYLLGRMFRKYPSGGSTENIIIYAGTYHANLYVSFLNFIRASKTIDIYNANLLDYIEFKDADKARSFLFNP